MNVPLQHNILCSVRSPIDNTDDSEILCKRQEFIGFKFIFFTTNGTRVRCNENPFCITILYKKISYLQKKTINRNKE